MNIPLFWLFLKRTPSWGTGLCIGSEAARGIWYIVHNPTLHHKFFSCPPAAPPPQPCTLNFWDDLPHENKKVKFLHSENTVCNLFPKQMFRTFPGLWFYKGSKIHINPNTSKISMLILLKAFHTLHIFLVEFNRFPELSRTCGLYPGLSDSPEKCQNKIPGFSGPVRTLWKTWQKNMPFSSQFKQF